MVQKDKKINKTLDTVLEKSSILLLKPLYQSSKDRALRSLQQKKKTIWKK